MARYCSGLLNAQHRALVEQHLDTCDSCSDAIALVVNQSVATSDEGCASEPIELTTGERIADYVVGEELGRGGMGIVYAAYDVELDRDIALKVVADLFPDKPLREARALARLDTPHVVRVHKVLRHRGQRIIAMERIDGLALDRWLRAKPTPSAVLAALLGAGRGLAAAHKAGVVHADIKPSNILIAEDGRARVTDFGLAMVDTEDRKTGGTPKYMAPEHAETGEATVLSDQYSYCLTVASALDFDVFANLRTLPKTAPSRVFTALKRGSAKEPSERFPNMETLLAELEPPSSARFVTVAAVGLTAGLLGLAAFWWQQQSQPAAVSCDSGAKQVAQVWNSAARKSLLDRFAKAAGQSAQESALRLEPAIDDFATRWAAGHKDACEATHVRGAQSAALLDKRMLCLQTRLGSLERFIQSISESEDVAALQRSLDVFDRLPAPEDCLRSEALAAVTPLPSSPESREEIAALEQRIANVKSDVQLSPLQAMEQLQAISESPALAHAPLRARYYQALGETHDALGAFAESEEAFDIAAKAAVEGHDDEQLARTLGALMAAKGYRLGKIEHGKAWAEAASLMLKRAGSSPENLALFHHNQGMALLTAGEFAKARKLLLQANEALVRLKGPSARELVANLDAIGTSYYREGDLESAQRFHEQSIELGDLSYGPTHKRLASAVNNLALIHMQRNDFSDALPLFARARTILTESAGPESAGVGMVIVNMAIMLSKQGETKLATAEIAQAMPILQNAFGPGHPMLAEMKATQSMIASEANDLGSAIAFQLEAIALRESLGTLHPAVLNDRYNLAGLWCENDQFDKAAQEWTFLDTHTSALPETAGWQELLLLGRAGCAHSAANQKECTRLAQKAVRLTNSDESHEMLARCTEARDKRDFGEE